MTTLLIILGWLLCGVLSYGFVLGSFTEKYPWCEHTGFAVLFGFGGPITMVIGGLLGGFKFRLKPLTKEQAWQAHLDRWPSLDRKNFERTY